MCERDRLTAGVYRGLNTQNVLFLRSRFGQLARSRFIAMGVLALIGTVALLLQGELSVILLSVSVLAVTATVAARTAHLRQNKTPRA